jgi:DNA-binding NarL/FixJ family response regulator
VAAADPLARTGLAALLAGQPGCTIVGRSDGINDLTSSLETYRPDVLGWEADRGVDHLGQLDVASLPITALVPDSHYAALALDAGAQGVLLRNAEVSTLAAAVHSVALGLKILGPDLAVSFSLPTPGPSEYVTPSDITPRELEVLRLLAERLPNKGIAHRLEISEHTVKFHVNSILGKLGAQSRTEAVTQATRRGLILL